MMSGKKNPAPADNTAGQQEQGGDVTEQLAEAARQCGVTAADLGYSEGGAGAAAIGDGNIIEKFKKILELIKKWGPIIGPILFKKEQEGGK